ncbi:MAG TPA: polysaccharide deacetylase family protein [archaeon]|nr:polysaccharide deacetylase family protein [archaeon]
MVRNIKLLSTIYLFCLISSPQTERADMNPEKTFHWPGGARAAVCLTYDDGIDGHLDIVACDLEQAGLRGTFYVPGSSESLARRMDEWRALARRGHELGNHTLFHPCIRSRPDGQVYEWVPPEDALENYTIRKIVAELSIANTLLQAVDGRLERTLAYPCYDHEAGGESFVEQIRPLFTAARAGGDIVPDIRSLDLYLVPAWSAKEVTGEEMIAVADRAAKAGTMVVFVFHGVGGGHNLNVSRQAHSQLLAYLDANRDRFWTDTFAKVTAHVRAEKKRLGWEQ